MTEDTTSGDALLEYARSMILVEMLRSAGLAVAPIENTNSRRRRLSG